jgi:hypothetical protein
MLEDATGLQHVAQQFIQQLGCQGMSLRSIHVLGKKTHTGNDRCPRLLDLVDILLSSAPHTATSAAALNGCSRGKRTTCQNDPLNNDPKVPEGSQGIV